MEIKKTIAESTASEITRIIIALLLPLLLGLVLALVPQARDHILPVLPKPLLAVLVGLSLSLNLALFFYVLYLRKSLAHSVQEVGDLIAHRLTPRFGILWSREQIPHCPACSKPLGTYFQRAIASGVAGTWGFRCVQCKDFVSMYDDTGRVLELREAKSLLSSQQTELIPSQVKPALDKDEILILTLTARFNKSTISPTTIADMSGLHVHAVKFHVHKLIEAGYLKGHSDLFSLTHKGREYLMANKLLT